MHFPRTAALHYGLSSVDTPINRPDGWPTKLALRRTGHAAGRQRARWYRGHWHAFAPTRFRVIRVNIGCDPCGRAAGRHGARQPSAWRIVRPGAGNPDLGTVKGLTPEPFSNVISCKMCFGAARPMGAGLYLVAPARGRRYAFRSTSSRTPLKHPERTMVGVAPRFPQAPTAGRDR
jgi:hypothetical protein